MMSFGRTEDCLLPPKPGERQPENISPFLYNDPRSEPHDIDVFGFSVMGPKHQPVFNEQALDPTGLGRLIAI